MPLSITCVAVSVGENKTSFSLNEPIFNKLGRTYKDYQVVGEGAVTIPPVKLSSASKDDLISHDRMSGDDADAVINARVTRNEKRFASYDDVVDPDLAKRLRSLRDEGLVTLY